MSSPLSTGPTRPDARPASHNRQSQSVAVLPAVESSAQVPTLYPRSVARYQRVRPLGEGGNGEVDLWRDQDIDRDVAVKRLKQVGTPEAVAQFIQEVQTTGQLEHPGIVPIYDVGRDEEGRYFFVMKHVQGETLEQIIARLRAADPAYLCRYSFEARTHIFMQILHSVQYAHRKGFVHCDIKPANVTIERETKRTVPRRGEVLANHGLRCGTVGGLIRCWEDGSNGYPGCHRGRARLLRGGFPSAVSTRLADASNARAWQEPVGYDCSVSAQSKATRRCRYDSAAHLPAGAGSCAARSRPWNLISAASCRTGLRARSVSSQTPPLSTSRPWATKMSKVPRSARVSGQTSQTARGGEPARRWAESKRDKRQEAGVLMDASLSRRSDIGCR